MDQQANGLAMAIQPIAADPGVQKALRESDADRLLAAWRPVFETLHRENHLTHFYFFDINRTCLLRIHKPEKRGDRIDRFTALKAERTGKMASGLELGPLGTFTLRVVQPVFESGRLVGYVELGKEIEEVLESLHRRSGIQLAVILRKESLNRQTWEEGMRLLGRQSDWDRMHYNAVIYASQGRLPDTFAVWAEQAVGDHADDATDREIAFDGKDWRVSAASLQDVSGANVGHLLIMCDISIEKSAFANLMAMGEIVGGLVLALLMGFIYMILRRTDAAILAQQATLRKNEEIYRTVADYTYDWEYWLTPDGSLPYLSPSCERITGYSVEEFQQDPGLLVRIVHPDDRNHIADHIYNVGNATEAKEHYELECRIVARSGGERWIHHVCRRVYSHDGKYLGHRVSNRDISTRKKAEARLHQIEVEKYEQEALAKAVEERRILLDNIQTQVWYLTDDHTYGAVNAAHAAFVGVRPEDLAFKSIYDIFPGDVVELHRQGNGEVFINGKSMRTEEWLPYGPSGERRLLSILRSPIPGADGRVQQVVCSAEDITDRKQAEKSLRESEERLHSLFEYSPDAYMIIRNGFIVDCNQATEVMLRGERKLIIGQSPEALSPEFQPDGRKSAEAAPKKIDEALETGSLTFEWMYRRLDGADFWVEVYLSAIMLSGKKVLFSSWRDFSLRKQAEDELKEKSELIKLLLSSTAEGIYGLDLSGRCVFCNPACLKILGYESDSELLGKNMHDLIHHSYLGGRHYSVEDCPIFKAFQKGEGTHIDNEVLWRKDGTSFPAEYWSFPMCKEGVVIGAVVTFLDITERKRADEDKERLQNKLLQAQKMEAIGTMAGGIAHDFNNILGAILGYNQLALLETKEENETKYFLNQIHLAGRRATDLVKHILSFSRQTEQQRIYIQVSPLIKETLKLIRASIPSTIEIRQH
ncbi:MAG: PAS domain S-box protein, partial [Deltaproteobacteria bacterium]|nr:PAS domain S-box protein [Deltaproteobacteria bacterium]